MGRIQDINRGDLRAVKGGDFFMPQDLRVMSSCTSSRFTSSDMAPFFRREVDAKNETDLT